MTDLKPRDKRMKSDLGDVLIRLDKPRRVGEITAAEANELRARNAELQHLGEREADLRRQLEHVLRLTAIVTNEKGHFVRGICGARGLSAQDEFNIDLDAGAIMQVAEMRQQPKLEAVKED